MVGLLDGHHGDFVVGSNGRELYSYETGHHDVLDDFPLDLALAAGRALRGRIDGIRLAVFTDVAVWADAGWTGSCPSRVPFGPVGDALMATGRFALRVGAFHPDRRAETYLGRGASRSPSGCGRDRLGPGQPGHRAGRERQGGGRPAPGRAAGHRRART